MTSSRTGTRRATPGQRQRLERLQQLKVLAHPLRLRLLEVFALGPATTMQAAARLGEPPTRLYHHVYAMQRAGLLRLTGTRPNRGTVEKYFVAVAHRFEFDPGPSPRVAVSPRVPATPRAWPAAAAAAGTIADALRDDVRGLAPASDDPVRPIVVRAVIHASAARIREIRAELTALLARLTRRPPRARAVADPRRYALTLALLRSESKTRRTTPGRRAADRRPARADRRRTPDR
ncbi:MAG: ArsR/SmtB family transcription factor [Candidatus Eisenbacteria bacterium]